MRALSMYRRLLGVSIRSQLQYPGSVAMQTVGQLLVTGGEFLGLWALFSRFGSLQGWRLEEVCVFYGLMSIAFAVADSVSAGLEHVGTLVRTGEFDRYLLRPRSAILQLLGCEVTLRRAGRFVQGTAVLVYGLLTAGTTRTAVTVAIVVWTTAGAVALFVGLRIVEATLAFRTVETLEIMNVFTYGGVHAGSHPFSIYARWFRRAFTFVVPIAAVGYYPAILLLGVPDPAGSPMWVGAVSPLAGLITLGAALLVWRTGIRWYSSTGS